MGIHNNKWTDEIKSTIKEMVEQKKSLTAICAKVNLPKINLIAYLKKNKLEHPELNYRKKKCLTL